MLILNRDIGQSIIIDGDIIVKVLSQINKSIKLGIEAPEHINIIREEILHRRWKQKKLDKTILPGHNEEE